MKPILSILSILSVVGPGCRHYPRAQRDDETVIYTRYSGEQSRWPTAPGSFTEYYKGITVYQGLPAKPYKVLGKVTMLDSTTPKLAEFAWDHQADAVIIVKSQALEDSTSVTPGASFGYAIGNTYQSFNVPATVEHHRHTGTVAWLIQFKTAKDIRLDELNMGIECADEHPNGWSYTNKDGTISSFTGEQVINAGLRMKLERDQLLNGTNSPEMTAK